MTLCSECSSKHTHDRLAEPSAPDCIHDKPCGACVALAALDDEIQEILSKLNRSLDRLQERRLDAITEVNRSHDPLIHKLPPEVASRIFAFYVATEGCNIYQPSLPLHFILASVCRVWRRIAFTTPELWSTLQICRYYRIWRFPVDLARQWIARSGQLPLDVTISWKVHHGVRYPVVSNMSATANLINEHYGRLRNFRLEIPKAALSLFKPDTNVPSAPTFPNLELIIGVVEPSQMYMNWNSITRLEMGHAISLRRSLKILRLCLRIETVRLSIQTSDRSRIPTVIAPILLQHLQVMIVKFFFDSPPQFFDTLTLPALQELRLDCEDYEDSDQFTLPFGDLESMLARSKCSLKTLALIRAMINDDELFHLLVGIPSLEYLDMYFNRSPFSSWSSSRLSDDFFNNLLSASTLGTENENANLAQQFLPILRTLKYEGPQSFSWSTLAKIYEAYSRPSPVLDLHDQRSEQLKPPSYQRPLQDLAFITPGPDDDSDDSDDDSDDYIDSNSLLRFLDLPKSTFKFKLNVDLLKASLSVHHITPSDDALLFYGVKLDRPAIGSVSN